MLINKRFNFKLKPTKKQIRLFSKYAGCCRFVYNKCLDINNQQKEKDPSWKVSKFSLVNLLPDLKKEFPWLSEVPSQCLQQSAMDLGESFNKFFKKETEYPVFHKKGINDSFRFPQHFEVLEDRRMLKLPKIGFVTYRRSRFLPGKPTNITIRRLADGWYASICCEWEIKDPVHPNPDSEVAIDMGVKRLATLSNDVFFTPIPRIVELNEKLKKLQRKLARKTKARKKEITKNPEAKEKPWSNIAKLNLR